MIDILFSLLIISIPVACISWTVTHEEVFREVHEYCEKRSQKDKSILSRKFFYLFTCEYCFSHYVTIALLIVTHYQLLYAGFVGYLISFFAIVFVANTYMSLFGKIRTDIKKEKDEIKVMEQSL